MAEAELSTGPRAGTAGFVTAVTPASIAATPPALAAPGTAGAPFVAMLPVADLPPGSMVRVTHGDAVRGSQARHRVEPALV